MGLDKPLVEQYQHFIVGLSRGDLGLSFDQAPVNDDIAETRGHLRAVLATIAIAFLTGIPLGVVAAAKKDGWADNPSVRGDPRCGDAELLLALLLQVLAGYEPHALPTTGRFPDFQFHPTSRPYDRLKAQGQILAFIDGLKHLLLPSPRSAAMSVRSPASPDPR
jgi:ABC-type dipeptide/oligopeptide/nickel transport system permease component